MGAARVNSVLELVNETPIVRLNRVGSPGGARLWAKLESFNPGGSVKDRIALAMVEAAERSGALKPGMTLVEPTSGNTGIGLAVVAAVKGYHLIITMFEGVSAERQKVLEAYGAEVVLTSEEEGMRGAIERALALKREHPDYVMLQQFQNPANPEAHRRTTAQEILRQMDRRMDAFVAGVGTGGTLTGVGEVLKRELPGVKVVAVEPSDSAVLSGGALGPTEIDGLGAGMIPPVLNRDVIDEVVAVTNTEARRMARRMAREEGVLCGISSGAAAHAAAKVARDLGEGKDVVVILPDTGNRYMSTMLFG
ncbi:MAG: cysteine synthase A [Candidatus Latescibacteria bacterium]|nr:cysteine synthase A [Candidatus Latescibacterota bacterium]